MKQLLIEYIKRPIPEKLLVIEKTIPVIFFGNIEMSEHATIGINPSKIEFLDRNNNLLPIQNKRFVDREILNISNQDILKDYQANNVYASLMNYFQKNPYRRWFDVLDDILIESGVSYYKNTLVHLDITPWATNPVWSKLHNAQRSSLIYEANNISTSILKYGQIRKLYINGRTVMNHIEDSITKMKYYKSIRIGTVNCEIKIGVYAQCEIIGWSTNLQSSFGVSTEFKDVLKDEISRI